VVVSDALFLTRIGSTRGRNHGLVLEVKVVVTAVTQVYEPNEGSDSKVIEEPEGEHTGDIVVR